MIIKLGEELRANRRTAIAQAKLIEVTRSEEELIFQCCSALGDNIKMIFNSATKDIDFTIAYLIWMTMIQSNYELLEEQSLIYIYPETYWKIYKHSDIQYQKSFIKNPSYELYINEKQYYVPKPDFYINGQPEDSGIYGIYYQDKLLYIGSSKGIMSRWKQHDLNFRSKKEISALYFQNYNPDKIEYKVLMDGNELKDFISKKQIKDINYLMEAIEAIYIKSLCPIYNIEGLKTDYVFKENSSILTYEQKKKINTFLTELTEHSDLNENLQSFQKLLKSKSF